MERRWSALVQIPVGVLILVLVLIRGVEKAHLETSVGYCGCSKASVTEMRAEPEGPPR